MIADDIQFCLTLIGKPWESGATGPDKFDCWGLVRYVFEQRRGLYLSPHVGISEKGMLAIARASKEEVGKRWERVDAPSHFCGVGMSHGSHVEHVGVWLDEGGGGVLHASKSYGVIFQSPATIRNLGFQNFTYYRPI